MTLNHAANTATASANRGSTARSPRPRPPSQTTSAAPRAKSLKPTTDGPSGISPRPRNGTRATDAAARTAVAVRASGSAPAARSPATTTTTPSAPRDMTRSADGACTIAAARNPTTATAASQRSPRAWSCAIHQAAAASAAPNTGGMTRRRPPRFVAASAPYSPDTTTAARASSNGAAQAGAMALELVRLSKRQMLAVPVDRPPQPVRGRDQRAPVQDLARAVDVGSSSLRIVGPRGHVVDLGR